MILFANLFAIALALRSDNVSLSIRIVSYWELLFCFIDFDYFVNWIEMHQTQTIWLQSFNQTLCSVFNVSVFLRDN